MVYPTDESVFSAEDEHSFWLFALELYNGKTLSCSCLTFGDLAVLADDVAARTRLNPVTALLAQRFAMDDNKSNPRPSLDDLLALLRKQL